MKLKNKKTGEIGWLENYYGDTDEKLIAVLDKKSEYHPYNSLAELNEEWCDYEGPKDFWFIDPEILIACESTEPLLCDKKVAIETMKEIGNYFETEEEAKKAVEKLKAWKRLKDKGIKIGKRRHSAYGGEMYWDCPNGTGISDKQIWLDLDLLFGGGK